MNNPYSNFTAKKTNTREQLPTGAYVAKILKAEEIHGNYPALLINFDISEGDYKDFFKKDYNANPMEDKKWRGTFRLSLGEAEWAQRAVENAVACLEESNPKFVWDWAGVPASLKGLQIGVNFRNNHWEFNGKSGVSTECGALCSVIDVHEGKVRALKDRYPKTTEPAPSLSNDWTELEDAGDLPF